MSTLNHNTRYLIRNTFESGVTLIEVLIYVALLSFIMSGALVSVYQIMSGDQQLASKNTAEEEAAFIVAKIEWALDDVSAINSPAPNTSGSTLSVSKTGYGSNPIEFVLNGTDITIEKNNSGNPIILNSGRAEIATLSFQFTQQTGASVVDSIKASFYVNGKYFETYKYIR